MVSTVSLPTIPEPNDDPDTHIDVLRPMKNWIEAITGQRKGLIAPYVRCFKTAIQPGLNGSPVPKSQLNDGDIWINTADGNKLYFWDTRGAWLKTT